MDAKQILDAIKVLPPSERAKVLEFARQFEVDDVPADLVEALDDFACGRFISMETALTMPSL